jgi:hypothetical protein
MNIRQGGSALRQTDLPGGPLNRHRGGHRGDDPAPDQKPRRILIRQPGLDRPGHRFIGQSGDKERRVEIEHQ